LSAFTWCNTALLSNARKKTSYLRKEPVPRGIAFQYNVIAPFKGHEPGAAANGAKMNFLTQINRLAPLCARCVQFCFRAPRNIQNFSHKPLCPCA
jgi:hypothetical protein